MFIAPILYYVADFCLMDLARAKHHLSKQCDIADRAAEAVHGN